MTSNYSLPRRLVQTRVLTNCPLCGFRQRIDRLTGLDFHVVDMERDLLPLEVAAVYAYKRPHAFHCELRPVTLKSEIRGEMLYALAAKMLPIVQYLRITVPEFREAISETVQVQIEREVRIEIDRPALVERVRGLEWELAEAKAKISTFKEVLRWQKVQLRYDAQIPIEREVELSGTWKSSWLESARPGKGLKQGSPPLNQSSASSREIPNQRPVLSREIRVPVEIPVKVETPGKRPGI